MGIVLGGVVNRNIDNIGTLYCLHIGSMIY